MPRLDQGADPADLPGPTRRLDAAAAAPRPHRPYLGCGPLVAQSRVECSEVPCLSPGPPSSLLAVPYRVFAVPGRPGGVGKYPPKSRPTPKPRRQGRLKSWKPLFKGVKLCRILLHSRFIM